MNIKLVIFSGIISAGIGAVVGLSASELARPKYQSNIYQNLHSKYAAAGAVVGLVAGTGQEAVRQLKKQRDKEEEMS
jgi:hypothetical protein